MMLLQLQNASNGSLDIVEPENNNIINWEKLEIIKLGKNLKCS